MFRKIVAFKLLLIFLLCTFQIGVATHICCGKIVDTKIFAGTGKASCGMEEKSEKPCRKSNPEIKKQCCKNILSKFQLNDDFGFSPEGKIISVNKINTTCLLEISNYSFLKSSFHSDIYLPPPPEYTILRQSIKILQVFRI